MRVRRLLSAVRRFRGLEFRDFEFRGAQQQRPSHAVLFADAGQFGDFCQPVVQRLTMNP